MRLWRPTGVNELRLVYESGMRAFPARLIDQPIFYPVLNREYASQIALDWNARRSGAGYVLSFDIDDDYASQFEKKIVGGSVNEELWIPAELLPDFNAHICGDIELDSAFFSADFEGYKTPTPSFGGLHEAFHSGTPRSQFSALCSPELQKRLPEVAKTYNTAIFLTYPYWCALQNYEVPERISDVLAELSKVWQYSFSISLCGKGILEV